MSKEIIGKVFASTIITAAFAAVMMVFIPYGSHKTLTFIITEGDSLSVVAEKLAGEKLIFSKKIFSGYVFLTGQSGRIKAGTYILSAPVSIFDLTEMFIGGDMGISDITVTIPEGTNVADMDGIFTDAGLIQKGIFMRPDIVAQEGYLFPDTYRFKPGIRNQLTAAEIIKKMRENFDTKTKSILGNLDSFKKKEIVIIASILEKEAVGSGDAAIISGIIRKRLELDMPLEIDATVSYGVCLPKLITGIYCDVSQANIVDNLRVDSVYNTYTRKGLPIGPISNPGLTALAAALHPQQSQYLYYLHTRDGQTIFSKTGSEHNAARRKYLGL